MQPELALSIIITTHNRPKHLKALLERLLPFAGDFELIVACDGDVVPTELLAPFTATLTYLQIPATGGPATGRNIGLDRCRGRYVLFCDDDDLLEPEWVKFLMGKHLPKGRLLYSNYRVMRGESHDLATSQVVKFIDLGAYTSRHLQVSNNIPVGAFAVDREETRQVRFLTRLQTHEDWDYLLQANRKLTMEHVAMPGVAIFLKPPLANTQESRNYQNVAMHPYDYLALYRLNPSADSEVARARIAVLSKFGLNVRVEAV
jgi:glycosyltransferase involved in cell wall biosynthesis